MSRKVYVVWGAENGHLKTGDKAAEGVPILNAEDLSNETRHKLFQEMFCNVERAA